MIGPLIGAGASIIGSLLGANSAAEANKSAQQKMQHDAAMQLYYATNGIQLKVQDAKIAGIHPLYALGAQTHNFQPTAVDFKTHDYEGIGKAGQDIGRALDAASTDKEKADGYTEAMKQLQVQRATLENQVLAQQLMDSKAATIRQTQNISLPSAQMAASKVIDGQGDAFEPKEKQLDRSGTDPASRPREHGSIADVGMARTNDGYAPVPSKDVKERIEDQFIPEMMWALRNYVLPTLGHNKTIPGEAPKPGYKWTFDPLTQEYRQVRIGSTPLRDRLGIRPRRQKYFTGGGI